MGSEEILKGTHSKTLRALAAIAARIRVDVGSWRRCSSGGNTQMHFRERAQVVQIIRTSYDPRSKKGKNQIVGRLPKDNPQISEALTAALTSEERKELATWIERHVALGQLKRELAVRTLPEQLALAEEWFADQKGDSARALARTLVPAWLQLRVVLKRNGFVE
jgi:hypothetical protein